MDVTVFERISNPQFIGLCEHHLQYWHKGRGFTEVAVADDVRVDVESVGVGTALNTTCHIVKATYNSRR